MDARLTPHPVPPTVMDTGPGTPRLRARMMMTSKQEGAGGEKNHMHRRGK